MTKGTNETAIRIWLLITFVSKDDLFVAHLTFLHVHVCQRSRDPSNPALQTENTAFLGTIATQKERKDHRRREDQKKPLEISFSLGWRGQRREETRFHGRGSIVGIRHGSRRNSRDDPASIKLPEKAPLPGASKIELPENRENSSLLSAFSSLLEN